jgi:non-ribosomal peptide synthase protein (TIGR01720 family)
MRFNEDLKQYYAGSIDFSKHFFDYQAANQPRKETLLQMNQMIDIKNGPVVVASIVDYGNAQIELCIVAHHLVVDAFSWSVFVEDLENNYHNVVLAKNQERRTSGTNLQQWANCLEEKSTETYISAKLPFWVKILKASTELPILYNSEKHPLENSRLITVSNIDLETSKKIIGYAAANKTLKMEHLALAIISKALCSRLLVNKITFMLERHGRSQIPESINISRTIGWFTVIHPFLVKSYESIIDQAYAITKDLKEINDDGISYGLLRHKDKELKALNEPAIAINFLGEMSRMGSNECFSDYKLLQDQTVDPKSPLEYKLEINSHISEGRLFFECTYNPQDISTLAIEQLIVEIKRNTEMVCSEIDNSQAKREFNIKLTGLSNDRLLAIQNRLNGLITNG